MPARPPPFDPTNQTFLIAGPDGVFNISVAMAAIDAERVRLADICISYGCQLGICVMTLLVFVLLVPAVRLRKPVGAVHLASLLVSVTRLCLLILYFPGPLTEYYALWTRDPRALTRPDYYVNTTANAFSVLQFALIEGALIMQCWILIRTWPDVWQRLIRAVSILLAVATIAVKSVWVVHHTGMSRYHTLPIPLDAVGEAATILSAVSVFYFCGIFFGNLCVHVFVTRGVLARPGRGLTSLEILAIGNGVLMVLPSIFAALDVSSGLSNNRVVPFDAGSWMQTLVVIGLPLIGIIAGHRGPPSMGAASRRISAFDRVQVPGSKAIGRGTAAVGRTPLVDSFMAAETESQRGIRRAQHLQEGNTSETEDQGERSGTPQGGQHARRFNAMAMLEGGMPQEYV